MKGLKNLSVDMLLELDYGEVWINLLDIIRNPGANLRSFALLLAVFTILLLLVIIVMIYIWSGSEDDDDYEDLDEEESENAAIAAAAALPEVEPEDPQLARRRRIIGSVVWGIAVLAIWVAGGYVSSRDVVCLSCHLQDSVHQLRIADANDDPHGKVQCVSCHEDSNRVVTLTTAVPARAVHYVAAFTKESLSRGYGTPIASSDCRRCHQAEVTGTFENKARGVKVSHKEPLEAGASCTDCHKPKPGTGVVDRFTVGMTPCLRCHDAKQASAECSYCHTKDIAYAMQSRGRITASSHTDSIDCSSCHSMKTCDACHGTRMPHSKQFMGVQHAREAAIDIWYNGGRTCKRCHTETRRPCTKCHRSPFNQHALNFAQAHQTADPYRNGCTQCHDYMAWMNGRNFCANCHEQYPQGQVYP